MIAKWDQGQKEQFICMFKPTAARNPAAVMAKEFANAIETNFPRLWSALTNGTCVNRVIVGDGAPVVPKTVEELKKYPQFKNTHYHYDHGHDHSVMIKHTVKQGKTLSGQVEPLLKVNSTLSNHSGVISKLILDGRNKDVKACDAQCKKKVETLTMLKNRKFVCSSFYRQCLKLAKYCACAALCFFEYGQGFDRFFTLCEDHFNEFFNNPLTEGGPIHGFKQFEALQSVFSYLIAIESAFLKLLKQHKFRKNKIFFLQNIDKNIKNPTFDALDFVKLALLETSEKQFQ